MFKTTHLIGFHTSYSVSILQAQLGKNYPRLLDPPDYLESHARVHQSPTAHTTHYTNISALLDTEKSQALALEVKRLSEKEAICPAMSDVKTGFTSPIFVVPKPGGAWFPIINLRELNCYIL